MDPLPDIGGGREQGVAVIIRAWGEVVGRPRTFYRTRVVPGAQAPGLLFAMGVVFTEEILRFLLRPSAVPSIAGGWIFSMVISLGVAVLLITPAALHVVAGIQTLLLIPIVDDRAGISETVQVFGYATAPCVLAGVPVPELRVVCTGYGVVLLMIGVAEIHRVSDGWALVLSVIPGALVFGYGFRGFAAIASVLAKWYII